MARPKLRYVRHVPAPPRTSADERHLVSAASKVARRWKLIVAGVLLAAAEAFFINKVSSDNPAWWWWLLLLLALIGVVGCALWALFAPTDEGVARQGDNTLDGDVKDVGSVAQQSAGDKGSNVSVHADRGSFAANRVDKIEKLSFGVPQPREDPTSLDSLD